jgi:hypothetical protein
MNRSMHKAFTAAAALLVLGMAGCTDTLEVPQSTVSETLIFKTPNGYRQLLAKIYGGLQLTGQQGPAGNGDISAISDEGFTSYSRLYWEMQELPTDEAVLQWGDDPIKELNTATWGSSNSFVAGMFSRMFLQIALANEFLRQTTDGKLSERGQSGIKAQVQQWRAEARFLRALSYWHALDLYGPVPIVTSISTTPPKQNTRQEVYDFLVTELTTIQADLPAAGAGTYGRATQEAASMLLAKLYLNAEVYTGTPHYAEALTAAQAVINGPFSIDPTWRNVFAADNDKSPEMVFPVIADGRFSKSYGGVTFLIHAACGAPTGATAVNGGALGIDPNSCWYGIRLKPQAADSFGFAGSDTRNSHFVRTGRTSALTTVAGNWDEGIAAPKFSNFTSLGAPGSDNYFPDTDLPMFRLADAYLIYAEAAVRTGTNLSQALNFVNQLRVRAYGDSSGVITAPQLDLPFILAERGRELLWEGHRRTDLIRFGVFTGGSYLWAFKGSQSVAGGTSLDPTRALYPLPAAEVAANPNLTQNPGY